MRLRVLQLRIFALCWSFVLAPGTSLIQGQTETQPVSFMREVAPILKDQCVSCHRADKAKGGYRLHTFRALTTPGTSGERPIVPSHPNSSHLLDLLTRTDSEDRMPQDADSLPPSSIELIRRWIEQGAVFDGPDPESLWTSALGPALHPPPPLRYPFPWPVSAVTFDAAGEHLLTSGYREVRVWEAGNWKLVRRWTNLPERVLGIALHPQSSWAAVAGGLPGRLGETRWMDVSSGQFERVLHTGVDVFLSSA